MRARSAQAFQPASARAIESAAGRPTRLGIARCAFHDVSTLAADRLLRAAARLVARRNLVLRVEGLENLPIDGPVLLAARHFHHLYDGVVLLDVVPRPLHILVALDWIDNDPLRRVMEWATRTARWPVVLREERLRAGCDTGPQRHSAFSRMEVERFHLRGVRDSVALLCAGSALVIFPEGYPNIDPTFTPKRDAAEFLSFRAGFTSVVALAQRRLRQRIPIVPVGLAYEPEARWRVAARFGTPLYLDGAAARSEFIRTVQGRVEELSGFD